MLLIRRGTMNIAIGQSDTGTTEREMLMASIGNGDFMIETASVAVPVDYPVGAAISVQWKEKGVTYSHTIASGWSAGTKRALTLKTPVRVSGPAKIVTFSWPLESSYHSGRVAWRRIE